MTTAQLNDVNRLRDSVGRVVTPVDANWDQARLAYNLAVDQHPALIAYPRDARGVAAVVRFAKERELRVAPQRTGHNAGPLADALERTILLKTDDLAGVEIDRLAGRARVGAGMKWEHVVPQASEMGLAALHGSTPDVSIAGYSLGGGLGWYGRKHGLATNSITAIELVTADGELRRVDHDNESDLFWALRGGGGNFGVVTALEFELYPIREVYAGVMFFPFERSAEILHAWRSITPQMPEEMTTVGRILQFPPIPEVPEPVRGQSFVLVEGFYTGSQSAGEELLEPIRSLGPVMDTFAMVPPVGLAEIHMDPPDPMPAVSESVLMSDLTPEAIDETVALTGPGSGSMLATMEFRHLGGALARTEAHHGALAKLDGDFIMFAGGLAADAGMTAANQAQLALLANALDPYRSGAYGNFVERSVDASELYAGDGTYERLQRIRGEYDPDRLFRANHEIA